MKKNDRVLTSCLLLIGYIGAPDARKILLKYSTPRNLGYIRRNALIGLKGLQYTGAAVNQIAGQMLKYLGEADYPNIVQNALDIIEKLPLGKSYDAQWRKLLKSKHPSVRAFAARKLASNDNGGDESVDDDPAGARGPQVSEIAAGALARHKGATKLLLAALARERKAEARLAVGEDPQAARRVGGQEDSSGNSLRWRNAPSEAGEQRVRDVALFPAQHRPQIG